MVLLRFFFFVVVFFNLISAPPRRFQKHVHTYRILPDDEGFLAVQVKKETLSPECIYLLTNYPLRLSVAMCAAVAAGRH